MRAATTYHNSGSLSLTFCMSGRQPTRAAEEERKSVERVKYLRGSFNQPCPPLTQLVHVRQISHKAQVLGVALGEFAPPLLKVRPHLILCSHGQRARQHGSYPTGLHFTHGCLPTNGVDLAQEAERRVHRVLNVVKQLSVALFVESNLFGSGASGKLTTTHTPSMRRGAEAPPQAKTGMQFRIQWRK